MKNNLLIMTTTILVIYLFSGCAAKLSDPEINFEPPAYVEQMPAKEEQQNFGSTGSLFGKGDNPLFSDHKAMHVNDIVTVVISETAQSSSSGTKQLSENDTSNLGAGIFASTKGETNGAVKNGINGINGFSDIGFSSSSNNTYKGKGASTKDAKFSTTISARIVKVMRNGNYFISGRREILVDDQKQLIQISGVIRPYDIDQYNKINSTQISDAKILYKTQGDVDRATQQGWGTKIIQSVWPF